MDEAAQTPPQTRGELLARAEAYARTIPLDVDHSTVDWEVSERAKRRAGACLYNRQTESVTIRLTWRAYRAFGWERFTATIRHELVHAWEYQQFGVAGHGERFARQARRLDAPRHCDTFTEPRLRLVCTDDACEWSPGRHRASATVTHPTDRRCGVCGSRYVVEHVQSGERWRTHEQYRDVRQRLGTRW